MRRKGEYNIKVQVPSGRYTKRGVVNIKVPVIGSIREFISLEDKNGIGKVNFVSSYVEGGVEELLMCDIEYLYLYGKTLINPKNLNFEFTCDSCNKVNKIERQVKDIEIIDLPRDLKNPAIFSLPQSKKIVKVKLMDIKTWRKFLSAKLVLEEDIGELKRLDLDILELSYMLSGRVTNNVEFLNNLSLKDLEVLRLFKSTFKAGPVYEIEHRCSCGRDYILNIRNDRSFLGVYMDNLLLKYSYLAKKLGVGFNDFLSFTNEEVDYMISLQES